MRTSLLVLVALFLPCRATAIDKKELLVGIGLSVLTVADLESTFHALDQPNKSEGNALTAFYVNHGRRVAYPVQFAVNAAVLKLAHDRHKNGHGDWWIVPAVVMTGHGVAFGLNLRWR